MERLIDETWNSLLAKLGKKDLAPVRPLLGDDIDLYVPQIMTMLLMESNPTIASLIYKSSYTSANRNVFAIMKKLGMPADYFWKFEYWPKERAFETLKRVINRVFSTMMNLNKEGSLELQDVDVEHMRFTVSFKDCVECAGITAEKGICYYHAATFAGIISALINRDMDGLELKCHAKGEDTCIFIIGKRDDPEISSKMTEYLSPTKIQTRIDDRLDASLKGNTLRSIGNLVSIYYYRLLITNCIINNPTPVPTSFEIGVKYGTLLAPIITGFYQDSQLGVIKKYYSHLRQVDVTLTEKDNGIEIVLAECVEAKCAEAEAAQKKKELLDFICGECQGLVSGILGKAMVFKDSAIEGTNIKVRLVNPG